MQKRESGPEPMTWQAYLGQLLKDKDARFKEQLVERSHLRPITLQRWVNGSFKPREGSMRTLLKNFPTEHYAPFVRLVAVDFPELLQEESLEAEQESDSLPAEFYARVLSTLAISPLPMGREAIQNLLFEQAIDLLDAQRGGLSLSLVCCVPPRPGEKIHSLREVGGVGTPPWPTDLKQKTMFLGAESLAGHTLVNLHFDVINSRYEASLLPANWTEHEQSVATFPLARFARVAGCLLVSSTEEGFFTPRCIALLEHIAQLASLIFEPDEFYDPELINLKMMPSEKVQATYFRNFNQRVSRKFAEVTALHQRKSLQEVHQLVWQDIQDELVEAFLSMDRQLE